MTQPQPCPRCHGRQTRGSVGPYTVRDGCPDCDDVGMLGVDPFEPCKHPPGSLEKVAVMAARYRAGVPLCSDEDKLDFEDCVPAGVERYFPGLGEDDE